MSILTATPAPQQSQAETDINAALSANTRDAKWNFGIGVLSLATWSIATVFFPPAGVAGFLGTMGSIMSMVKGWDLLGNLGQEKALEKAKAENIKGVAADKPKSRLSWLKKYNNNGFKIVGGIVIGALAVSLLGPLVAPAAIVHTVASAVGIVGAVLVTPLSVINGAKKGTETAVRAIDAQEQRFKDVMAAAASALDKNQPGTAISNLLPPSVSFGKAAVNDDAPAQQQLAAGQPRRGLQIDIG